MRYTKRRSSYMELSDLDHKNFVKKPSFHFLKKSWKILFDVAIPAAINNGNKIECLKKSEAFYSGIIFRRCPLRPFFQQRIASSEWNIQ